MAPMRRQIPGPDNLESSGKVRKRQPVDNITARIAVAHFAKAGTQRYLTLADLPEMGGVPGSERAAHCRLPATSARAVPKTSASCVTAEPGGCNDLGILSWDYRCATSPLPIKLITELPFPS